ncbi:MAG: hypothetical protein WA354_00950 [Terracidiphilus sp.]
MSRISPLGVFAALILCCSLPAAAQDRGYWRAVSTNAMAITGDLSISESRLSINLTSAFSIAQIRPLKPAESSAIFDVDLNETGSGYLYRLNVPAAKRFLHHNTLCGSDDTQWMATFVHDRALRVAFFSGTDMPLLTSDALANSTDVCGTYTYSR